MTCYTFHWSFKGFAGYHFQNLARHLKKKKVVPCCSGLTAETHTEGVKSLSTALAMIKTMFVGKAMGNHLITSTFRIKLFER